MSQEKTGKQILLVATDPGLRRQLKRSLGEDQLVIARDPSRLGDPAELVDAAPAVVVLDGSRGDDDLRRIEAVHGLPAGEAIVLLSVAADEDLLSQAIVRLRPRQVVIHPAPAPALRFAIRAAIPGSAARDQQRPARALLGVSMAIRSLIKQIAQVAPSRANVLVLGETGTGKELVARALHEQSDRAHRSFVAINCGALAESLLEAELFGFEKGAFTGATADKRGLFHEADGGTLFLDEIGETSPALQVKLLRAIEAREIRPIGSTKTQQVDVRIVSSTNRDLEEAMEQETFRQDLYYRLNTVTLQVPPLRRRRVDISFLAQHFAEELGEEYAQRITLSEDFLEAVSQRDFPGNVRELRNTVERAIALASPGEPVTIEELGADASGRPAYLAMGTLRDRVTQVELQAIREALERFDGNRTKAAEILGLSRPGLRNKMKRLHLD